MIDLKRGLMAQYPLVGPIFAARDCVSQEALSATESLVLRTLDVALTNRALEGGHCVQGLLHWSAMYSDPAIAPAITRQGSIVT